MFTGIVQNTGVIRRIDKTAGLRLHIETPMTLDDVKTGASISCAGCCLTVTGKDKNSFTADVSPETLRKTVIGAWVEGTGINLEKSLRLGDTLDGHFVSGHVDGIATIEKIAQEGRAHCLDVRAPVELARFVAPKGSVALDGVSLTINGVEGNIFSVTIIPHSWANTTLNSAKAGDRLNIEIDMLARYVARLLEKETA